MSFLSWFFLVVLYLRLVALAHNMRSFPFFCSTFDQAAAKAKAEERAAERAAKEKVGVSVLGKRNGGEKYM